MSCPSEIWDEYNLPNSFLKRRSLRTGAEEILGLEFAMIATAIWRYYGSLDVFDRLRTRYCLIGNRLYFKI